MRFAYFIGITLVVIVLSSCGSSPYMMKVTRVDEGKDFKPEVSEIGSWTISGDFTVMFNPSYKRFYVYENQRPKGDLIPILEEGISCFFYRENPGVIYLFPKNSNMLCVYSKGGRKILGTKILMLKEAMDITISPYGYLYILDTDGSIVRTDYEGITIDKIRSHSKGSHFKIILPNPELLIILCRNGELILYDSLGHYQRTETLKNAKTFIDLCFDMYGNAFMLDKVGVWLLSTKDSKQLITGNFTGIAHDGKENLYLKCDKGFKVYKVEYEKIKIESEEVPDIF